MYYGEDIAGLEVQGIRCIGKVTDLAELRRLYSLSTLGIAFSTTNPSLIPFEMLACGLPVVDVLLNTRNPDFDGCDAVVYSKPTEEDLCKSIYRLAMNSQGLADLSSKAINWSISRPSETKFAQDVLSRLGLV